MPMSDIELCAAALVKIGARPFAAFAEDTAEAACARRLYPLARDLLFGLHPWSFTLAQVRLVSEAEPPVADFVYAFVLPDDHLRTVSVGTAGRSRGTAYRVQGGRILCDAEEIVLNYQRRVPEAELPAFFVFAPGDQGSRPSFCIPLTEGSSRAMDLYRLAEAELRGARLIDSQQTTPQAFDDFTLIEARVRMSRTFLTKTSFTAGELDPLLRGRLDLKAQEDGAARLRNVVVRPSGGVSRRPGLRLVAPLPGALRLVSFEGTDGGELLAFGAYRLDILRDGTVVHTVPDTLWGPLEVPELSTARWGDRLLICHPAVPPKELVRNGVSGWQLRDWSWEQGLDDGEPRDLFPFARFVRPEIAIQVNDGTAAAIAAGSPVRLLTSEPVFTPDHIGAIVAIKGRHIRIVNPDPVDRQRAIGVALQSMRDGKPTRDWLEEAFSEAHGWPSCVTVHQERLVIGGSRDVPDRMWFSKTGHPFNFDPGTGLDDEAISFRLAGDEEHAIRGLLPGRLLQVFTTSGEWVVRGAPITPATVAVELQTRIGSWPGRRLDPVEVDGAALFVGASGRELREFLYAESEQAYQAADIALLSRHLMVEPAALRFDRHRRWLLVVRDDGTLVCVALDRNSNVVAWSLLACSGAFRSLALHAGEPHFLIELAGQMLLERFDETLMTDHALTLVSPTPITSWGGLAHLEGQAVVVEGAGPQARTMVAGGAVISAAPTLSVTVGAAYAHEVEPMSLVVPTGAGVSLDRLYRPVRLVFRLLATGALRVDAGAGQRALPLGPLDAAGRFSGDAELRASGWRRGGAEPPWRVVQDDPVACTILSVTSEIMGNT